jgi:NitT/TauT family transport system permease protein
MRKWLYPPLLLIALVGAWQIAASTGLLADLLGLEEFLVPSPAEIGEALWESRSVLLENGWTTLQEILLGYASAVLVGVGFALAMHLSESLRLATHPLLIASQAIPIVVFAPVLVILFGYGLGPKVFIVAVVCFFPITIATFAGLRSVDPDAIAMMRTLYASRAQILRRVEGPHALPDFFSGAKIGAAIAPIGAFLAEYVGSSSGLGRLIQIDNANLQTARVFAAAFVLSLMAIALYGLVALAQRLVVSWR